MSTKIRRPASTEPDHLLCPPAPGTPSGVAQGSPWGWRAQPMVRFCTGGPSLFYFTTFHFQTRIFHFQTCIFHVQTHIFHVILSIVWSMLAPTHPLGSVANGSSYGAVATWLCAEIGVGGGSWRSPSKVSLCACIAGWEQGYAWRAP